MCMKETFEALNVLARIKFFPEKEDRLLTSASSDVQSFLSEIATFTNFHF